MSRFRPAVEVLSNQEHRLRLVHTSAITSGGSKGGHEGCPRGPNSFNFMQFLGKFGKIICWRPPSPEGWCPHLGEILDPQMNKICNKLCNQTASFRISLICFVVSNH